MASDWIAPAVGLLLDASLRVFALAVLVWLVLAGARVRSSAVRHRTWTAALGSGCARSRRSLPALASGCGAVNP